MKRKELFFSFQAAFCSEGILGKSESIREKKPTTKLLAWQRGVLTSREAVELLPGGLDGSGGKSTTLSSLWRNRQVQPPLRVKKVAQHSNAFCEYQIKVLIKSSSREKAEMTNETKRAGVRVIPYKNVRVIKDRVSQIAISFSVSPHCQI